MHCVRDVLETHMQFHRKWAKKKPSHGYLIIGIELFLLCSSSAVHCVCSIDRWSGHCRCYRCSDLEKATTSLLQQQYVTVVASRVCSTHHWAPYECQPLHSAFMRLQMIINWYWVKLCHGVFPLYYFPASISTISFLPTLFLNRRTYMFAVQ